MTEFRPYPKIARLNRRITVSEKLDGTNAAVVIISNAPDGWGRQESDDPFCIALADGYAVFAQSRKRLITPKDDNFGFAKWVQDNAAGLVDALGEGTHFGEWWGHGIQRGYALPKGERRFSLFNTSRWASEELRLTQAVPGLTVVPVLYEGPFDQCAIKTCLEKLREHGSYAIGRRNPGEYKGPEGIVIFHHALNGSFKVTLEHDSEPKSCVA